MFPPRLPVSSEVFQVVFVHLVYNSALFLASCCFLSILVACHSQCDLYLLSFSPAGSTFNFSKISLFLFEGKNGVPGYSSEKFHLDWCQSYLSFSPKVQISLPNKIFRRASALYTFILENFWTKVGLKVFFKIPSTWEIFLDFVEHSFHFHRKFHNRDI